MCEGVVMKLVSVIQLDLLDRSQLASRLTLNCTDSYIEPQKLKDVYVTIMDVRTIFCSQINGDL